jgi:hypothetical protein
MPEGGGRILQDVGFCGRGAHRGEQAVEDRFHQVFARGEVAVERRGAKACRTGDCIEADAHSVVEDGMGRGFYEALPVAGLVTARSTPHEVKVSLPFLLAEPEKRE